MARTVATKQVNELRDSSYVYNPVTALWERSTLVELASTNLCLQSENFGTTWTALGSPTRSAAAHTASGVSLDLIGDDDAGALEGYLQNVTFTADATKAFSLFVKQGTSTSSLFKIRDTTAGADRCSGVLTWSAGLPVVTMGVGTYYGYVGPLEGDVYRLLMAAPSVVAANTNQIQILPATTIGAVVTNTGTLYVGGVQASNNPFPTSYSATTTASVTRAVDNLSMALPAGMTTPGACTIYAKFIERGTILTSGARILQIGTTATNVDSLRIGENTAGKYAFTHNAGGVEVASGVAAAPSYGDTVELRGVLSATGTVTLGQSVNGGTESVGATSATQTLPASWGATPKVWIGSRDGTAPGAAAFLAIKIARGSQSLTAMRAFA